MKIYCINVWQCAKRAASKAQIDKTGTEVLGMKGYVWQWRAHQWGWSNSSLQSLLAVGFNASFHRHVAKKPSISQRQKARQRGQPCWPLLPDHPLILMSFGSLTHLHLHRTLFSASPLSLPLILSLLSISPTQFSHAFTHIHTAFPACCLQPEESGNQRQWSVSVQEQCARGRFVKLAKEDGADSIITDQHRRKQRAATQQHCWTGSLSLAISSNFTWYKYYPLWKRNRCFRITRRQYLPALQNTSCMVWQCRNPLHWSGG